MTRSISGDLELRLLLDHEYRCRLIGSAGCRRWYEFKCEDAPMPTDRLFEDAYDLDKQGRRVLIGLAFDETAEFERLDASLPFDGLHVWPDISDDIPLLPIEVRWRELWAKHQAAMSERPVSKQRA